VVVVVEGARVVVATTVVEVDLGASVVAGGDTSDETVVSDRVSVGVVTVEGRGLARGGSSPAAVAVHADSTTVNANRASDWLRVGRISGSAAAISCGDRRALVSSFRIMVISVAA
jgi:hypothetical protein